MKRLIKTVSALLLTGIMIISCGCGGSDINDMEPRSVPYNGWTAQTLFPMIHTAGHALDFPVTLSSFGDKVTLKKDTALDGGQSVWAGLMYKNEMLCIAIFRDTNDIEKVTDTMPITDLYFTRDVSIGEDQIWINGLKFGDTKERMVELLGEPDEKKGDSFDSTQIYYLNKEKTCTMELEFLLGKTLYEVRIENLEKVK